MHVVAQEYLLPCIRIAVKTSSQLSCWPMPMYHNSYRLQTPPDCSNKQRLWAILVKPMTAQRTGQNALYATGKIADRPASSSVRLISKFQASQPVRHQRYLQSPLYWHPGHPATYLQQQMPTGILYISLLLRDHHLLTQSCRGLTPEGDI